MYIKIMNTHRIEAKTSINVEMYSYVNTFHDSRLYSFGQDDVCVCTLELYAYLHRTYRSYNRSSRNGHVLVLL